MPTFFPSKNRLCRLSERWFFASFGGKNLVVMVVKTIPVEKKA